MTQPTPQQPYVQRINQAQVIHEQGATIGAMTTQLLMANLELEAERAENARLREELAGYKNDMPADTDSDDDESEAEARAAEAAQADPAAQGE